MNSAGYLKVQNSTEMNVLGFLMPMTMHNKPAQALSFNVIVIEGTVLLSCTDAFTLGLALASDKLEKKLPSNAKLVINKGDISNVLAVSKKIQGCST